ncbi:MAG: hypothetical protein ABIA75_01905 [Candidatus Neomarinimicrobiota bacterium]
MIEMLLFFLFAAGTGGAIAASSKENPKKEKDNPDNTIISLTDFQKKKFDEYVKRMMDNYNRMNQSLGQRTTHSFSSYKENPVTGDYVKMWMKIDIEDD